MGLIRWIECFFDPTIPYRGPQRFRELLTQGVTVDNHAVDPTQLQQSISQRWYRLKGSNTRSITLVEHGSYYVTFAGDAATLGLQLDLPLLHSDGLLYVEIAKFQFQTYDAIAQSKGIYFSTYSNNGKSLTRFR